MLQDSFAAVNISLEEASTPVAYNLSAGVMIPVQAYIKWLDLEPVSKKQKKNGEKGGGRGYTED